MRFTVQAPDGRRITLEGDKTPTEQELNEIFGYSNKQPQEQVKETTDNQIEENKSYLLGRLGSIDRGITFGLARKAGGLINAIGSYPVDRIAELVGVKNTPSFMDRYHEIVDPTMQAIDEYHKDKPVEATTLELGSSFLNPVNKFGVGFIGKGGNLASKAARSAGVGGAVGGIAGATNTENADDLAGNTLGGVEMGAAVGGALPLTGAAVKGLGNAAKWGLSKTTGAGAEAIDRAYDAGIRKSKVFLDNMRGKAPAESVVAQAKNEISGMVEGNSDLYRANMDKAFSDTTKLDVSKIMDKFREIKAKTTADGLKNARGDEKKVLKEIAEYLKPYRKNKELHTTQWLDDLRQDIYSIKTDTGTKANRWKKQMENIIKDTISEQRPEYREGLKTFAKNKAEIEELQRVFSLNDKASIDTALRKIQSLGRNNVQTNYGYRNALMDKLDFNGNIRDAAAGQLLNTWIPRGLQAGAVGGVNIYSALMNPALLPEAMTYAAASSPRVVGELAYGLGRMSTKLPSGNISPYLAQIIAQNQ